VDRVALNQNIILEINTKTTTTTTPFPQERKINRFSKK
jgi:hypothetical protein